MSIDSVREALEVSQQYDEGKRDFQAALPDFRFDGIYPVARDLMMTHTGPMSKHAFYQLADRLTIRSGAKFLWNDVMNFHNEFAGLMNRFLQEPGYTNAKGNGKGPKQVFARMYGEGGTNHEFRAFLSEQYVPYDNSHLLQVADEFVGDAPHEIIRPAYYDRGVKITPDDLRLKAIFRHKDTDDGPYGSGFGLINSEIGGVAIRIPCIIWRNSCRNSIIVMADAEAAERGISTRIPHRWLSHKQIDLKVHEALAFALQKSPEYIDEMALAARKELPRAVDILGDLVQGQGLGKDLVEHVKLTAAMGMEGQQTAGGIINGLSFAASQAEDLSDDQQTELEVLAGEVLKRSVGVDDSAQLANSFFALAKSDTRVFVEKES